MTLEEKIKAIWNILNTDVTALSRRAIKNTIKYSENKGRISREDAESFYNQIDNKKIINYLDDFFVHTAVLNISGWAITGLILKDYSAGNIDLKTAGQGLLLLGPYSRTMWTSYEILREKYLSYIKNTKGENMKKLKSDRTIALVLGIFPYVGSGAYALQIASGTNEERKFGNFLFKSTLLRARDNILKIKNYTSLLINKIYKPALPNASYGKDKNYRNEGFE
jgi:hypothetical protein